MLLQIWAGFFRCVLANIYLLFFWRLISSLAASGEPSVFALRKSSFLDLDMLPGQSSSLSGCLEGIFFFFF